MVGTPFPLVGVSVTTLPGVIRSPPITAVLVRPNVFAIAVELLLLRFFISNLRVLLRLTPTPSHSSTTAPRRQFRSARVSATHFGTLLLPASDGAKVLACWGEVDASRLKLATSPPRPTVD